MQSVPRARDHREAEMTVIGYSQDRVVDWPAYFGSTADEKCYKCGRSSQGREWSTRYGNPTDRAICLDCVFEVPEELRDEHR